MIQRDNDCGWITDTALAEVGGGWTSGVASAGLAGKLAIQSGREDVRVAPAGPMRPGEPLCRVQRCKGRMSRFGGNNEKYFHDPNF